MVVQKDREERLFSGRLFDYTLTSCMPSIGDMLYTLRYEIVSMPTFLIEVQSGLSFVTSYGALSI